MKAWLFLLPFLILTGNLHAQNSKIVRPAAGTPVRKAVCDEMRRYLRYSGEVEKSFGNFLFKVEELAVQGDYAVFEGYPVDENGESSIDLPDFVYTTFLKKSGNGWEVIADLSRTDVPSDGEMREIRRTFPKGIPTEIIPEYWRQKLRG